MAWPKIFLIEDEVPSTLQAEAIRRKSESKKCSNDQTSAERKSTNNRPHSSTKKKSVGRSSWPTTVFCEQENKSTKKGSQEKKIHKERPKKVPANELWPSTIFLEEQRRQEGEHISKETRSVIQSRTTETPSRTENKWSSPVLPESREQAQNQRLAQHHHQQIEQEDKEYDLLVNSPVARKEFSFSAICC